MIISKSWNEFGVKKHISLISARDPNDKERVIEKYISFGSLARNSRCLPMSVLYQLIYCFLENKLGLTQKVNRESIRFVNTKHQRFFESKKKAGVILVDLLLYAKLALTASCQCFCWISTWFELLWNLFETDVFLLAAGKRQQNSLGCQRNGIPRKIIKTNSVLTSISIIHFPQYPIIKNMS